MPTKFIVVLCYNRSDHLQVVLDSLLGAIGIEEYHFRVFCDGAKSAEDFERVEKVLQFWQAVPDKNQFKSFAIFSNDINRGVWYSKLNALRNTFINGSDVTLLIEDDVSIRPDGLRFVDDAFPYVQLNCLPATISLYSQNLEVRKNANYFKALHLLRSESAPYAQWGVRAWPFPWGIAFTKENYAKFISLGWNGNDQHLGVLLQENAGVDIFPIISRSEHLGDFSSTQNEEIKVSKHIDYKFEKAKSFCFAKDINIESGRRVADYWYTALMNDGGLGDDRMQVFYIYDEDLAEFQKLNVSMTLIPIKLNRESFDLKNYGALEANFAKLYCTNVRVLIKDPSFFAYVNTRLSEIHKSIVMISTDRLMPNA